MYSCTTEIPYCTAVQLTYIMYSSTTDLHYYTAVLLIYNNLEKYN